MPDNGGLFDQTTETVNKIDRTLQARNQWFKDDSDKKSATAEQQRKLREQHGT